MNSCELTASITALANLISSQLTKEELSLVSAVLMQLADTLQTIILTRPSC